MSRLSSERNATGAAARPPQCTPGNDRTRIAAALGVSHPTILRDLRDHDEAEAEQVLAALAGEPQRPKKPPPRLNTSSRTKPAGPSTGGGTTPPGCGSAARP